MFNEKLYMSRYGIKNRNKLNKYHRQWYKNNSKHIKKYHKKWRENNLEYREKTILRSKQWREDNQKYIKKYRKEWLKNNLEDYKEYQRIWKEENPEYDKKQKRKWRKTEKGKANNQRNHAKRQAREKEIINTLTFNEWLEILKKYHWKCAYCGKEFDLFNRPERDHIIPISKGGNNIKENIVPACRSCNARKKDKILK